jgi:hypothetical protein
MVKHAVWPSTMQRILLFKLVHDQILYRHLKHYIRTTDGIKIRTVVLQ